MKPILFNTEMVKAILEGRKDRYSAGDEAAAGWKTGSHD